MTKTTGRSARAVRDQGRRAYERADEAWSAGRSEEAFALFLEAARCGVPDAFRLVAQFYDFGEGTDQDTRAALTWYRRACNSQDDASAANNVGCIYRDLGQVGRAMWWLRRAVRLGDEEAHLNIARLYVDHLGDLGNASKHLDAVIHGSDVTPGTREDAERLARQIRRGHTGGRNSASKMSKTKRLV